MQVELMDSGVHKGATFSECRTWRYTLWRRWADGPALVCLALNPSTADELQDDPTIRRVIGFAKRWGFSAMEMLNIFSFRSTDPKALLRCPDPVGPGNDAAIRETCGNAGLVLVAWGVHGTLHGRNLAVADLLPRPVYCLGVTKGGHPKHPLYINGRTEPRIYQFGNV